MAKRELLRHQEIERSILTKYRGKLWGPFVRAIKEYELVKPNDKICVCISGGKDSSLLAKLFEELQKHSDFPFEVKYLVMNPGYIESVQKIIYIRPYAPADKNIIACPAIPKPTGSRRFLRLSV